MADKEAQVQDPSATGGDTTKETSAATPSPPGAAAEPKQTRGAPPAPPPVVSPEPATNKGKLDDSDDDEPHPDDKGLVTLPLSSFQTRIRRATRTELKRLFGTDNVQDIVEMKRELDERRKKDEEQRRASLAEVDRIREEAAQEKVKREAAERRAADLEESQLASQEDVKIRGIAERHIKGKYYKVAARELREHLVDEYGDDLDKVKYSDIEAWFERYAQENPELASPAAAAPPEAKPEEKKPTAPLTNGPQAGRPAAPASGSSAGGKTARPGQPNSMSKDEFAQLKRERGWNF